VKRWRVMKTKEGPAPEHLLSVSELSAWLQVPVGTIYKWHERGIGPRGMRVGRHVRFEAADVHRWLEVRKTEAEHRGWGR
jgi:excisionase family DNA binding protein